MGIWRLLCCFFFFKQKTAYEVRISDWSSDVCSSDLLRRFLVVLRPLLQPARGGADGPRGGGLLAAGRPVHRRHRACDPALALRALLHPCAEGDRLRDRKSVV